MLDCFIDTKRYIALKVGQGVRISSSTIERSLIEITQTEGLILRRQKGFTISDWFVKPNPRGGNIPKEQNEHDHQKITTVTGRVVTNEGITFFHAEIVE